MNIMTLGTRLLSVPALALALSCTAAHAQHLLCGLTTGSFEDPIKAHTSVSNEKGAATFRTGVPLARSTPSRIAFTPGAFNAVVAGKPIHLGLFQFTNGTTLISSGARTAKFNLGLKLTSSYTPAVEIGTITFHIDHTPNRSGSVPDKFSATFAHHGPVLIDNFLVQFNVNVAPFEFQLSENTTLIKGDITLSFAPVPEPSAYAALISVISFIGVAFVRVRQRRTLATPA